MSDSGLISDKIASDGTIVGIKVKAHLFLDPGQGFVLKDANGISWLYTANTDGSLNVQQVTF